MVNLTISSPPEELSKYIRKILFIKSNGNSEHLQKVISNPFVYLSFIPNNPPLPIVGNQNLPIDQNIYFTGPILKEDVVLKYCGKIEHLFYEFSALGFYSLFHTSPSRFTNKLLPFSKIVETKNYETLQSKLSDAKNISQQKNLIEEYLLELSKNSLPVFDYIEVALEIIEEHNGYIPVNRIIEQVNISERQLRRKFKQIIGLSPKTYCNVLSSHYIITCMQTKDYKSIQELALSSEYYDVAHFCNRFKKIMGVKPTEFINSNIVDFSKRIYRVG